MSAAANRVGSMGGATPKFKVWVQHKEENEAKGAVLLGDILPLFSEAGPSFRGKCRFLKAHCAASSESPYLDSKPVALPRRSTVLKRAKSAPSTRMSIRAT